MKWNRKNPKPAAKPEKVPRSLEAIQSNINDTLTNTGRIQYQVEVLKHQLNSLNNQLNQLDNEWAEAKKLDDVNKAKAAELNTQTAKDSQTPEAYR
jgi:septal ring factor EnvC (AmiA/AmiB activator)